jgi:hypothetical protein
MTTMAWEVKPMNVRSTRAICRRPSVVGRLVVAVALIVATVPDPVSADPQGRGGGGNARPNQPINSANPYAAAAARGRYAPYLGKDPTAAERAALAGKAFHTALDESVQRALTPAHPEVGPTDTTALYSPELAERLGRWSTRWQQAQDNAARSLAARYQALTDHRDRMSSLEDGRLVRDAIKRAGSPSRQTVEPTPRRLVADIARFFRPVDELGLDQIVPELVEVERPLNLRGPVVTPSERVEIAGRVYSTILDDAVAQFLASQPKGAARRDESAIFDAVLAERLGSWSELWSQAQDAAVEDPSARAAAARNRSARPAWAGERLAGPDSRPATIQAHIERMRALEDGRFFHDAFKRAGRPGDEPLDMTRLREFADVARYFRLDAESQMPEGSQPTGAAVSSGSRAAAAGRIYRATWDEAVRRYLEAPHAGGALPDARLVFDARLAERLGAWSIRWGRAQATASGDFNPRYASVRSHIERMASLEDGRALNDALARAGRTNGAATAPAPPREFAEVARFFRLQALWELARIKSR